MYAFSNKVLPIDEIIQGRRPDWPAVARNARRHPTYFLLELFACFLMIVGTIVVTSWAYELGKTVGFIIG